MGADVRELAIPFYENSETIEIVGTFLVPEFGTIAAIVLAVAIVGIIVATTRSGKFSFLPKM
jgi:predicted secreted protein with PEFG-CTERM motif